jgi:hypothetical protein
MTLVGSQFERSSLSSCDFDGTTLGSCQISATTLRRTSSSGWSSSNAISRPRPSRTVAGIGCRGVPMTRPNGLPVSSRHATTGQ